MEQLCISVITYAELVYGVERSSSKRVNRPIIEDFARHLDVVDWDTDAADHYGVIRAELEAAGTPIGAMDMMISAHAKSLKAVLVTNNQKHFTKVKGLKIENWISLNETGLL
jgi:tRNA(fMet)-specific endonuclease VapC